MKMILKEKKMFRNVKKIIEDYSRNQNANIDEKINLKKFILFCQSMNIELVRLQTEKTRSNSLSLVELFAYVVQKQKRVHLYR